MSSLQDALVKSGLVSKERADRIEREKTKKELNKEADEVLEVVERLTKQLSEE